MKKTKANSNFIISGLMVTAFAVIMGLLYDYFFDLNDDVLMKDIISGVFTGSPEGHNIQMQYPISFVLSLFYKVFRGFDWYGLFLLLCQYLGVFLIVKTISSKAKSIHMSVLYGVAVLFCAFGLMAGHFVFIQYTFTVAILCAASAVLVADRKRVLPVILVFVAFLIRSEMTLLMLPFVLLVVFYLVLEDYRKKEDIFVHVRLVIAMAICIVMAVTLNKLGYSSEEWKNFVSFFDSRTQIYDFYGVPDYQENKAFYDGIGLSESEYNLLVNYNFGIDDEINHETMAKIAEYAAVVNAKEPLFKRIAAAIPGYLYELRSVSFPKAYEYPMTYAPWNIVTGILYIAAFYIIMMNCKYGDSFKKRVLAAAFRVVILFAGRSALWLYILVRGRAPIRITHSLFLMEIIVLIALMIIALADTENTEEDNAPEPQPQIPFMILCVLACLFFIPAQVKAVSAEYDGRVAYNRAYEELEDYFKSNGDNFYFLDVYTSVSYDGSGYSYSKKMFEDVDNSAANWTLLGGWASKSPAEKDKLKFFGLPESIEEAVINCDNTYVVTLKEDDMSWLKDYYLDKEIQINTEEITEVSDIFTVWKVEETHESLQRN